MSAHDAAATFARGLAIGMFWAAVAILAILLVTTLIFWAQDVRARRSLPRERRGPHPVSSHAGSFSPAAFPQVAASVWEADAATSPHPLIVVESDVPDGVTLIEWRRRRREHDRGVA